VNSSHKSKPESFPTPNAAAKAHGGTSPGLSGHAVRDRHRAVIRLALGQGQTFGATLAFLLLLQQGTTTLVIFITAITGLLTVVSTLLFRVIWRDRSRIK
jgi:hypothetical protein